MTSDTSRTFAPAAARPFRVAPVLPLYLGSMGLLLWGLLRSPYAYTDPRFVAAYWTTEVAVAALLVVMLAVALPWRRCGVAWPAWTEPWALLPLAAQLGFAAWHWQHLQAQAAAGIDAVPTAAELLRTTLLVGVTEEGVYRGVLLAALVAWWGWRPCVGPVSAWPRRGWGRVLALAFAPRSTCSTRPLPPCDDSCQRSPP